MPPRRRRYRVYENRCVKSIGEILRGLYDEASLDRGSQPATRCRIIRDREDRTREGINI